MFSDAAGDTMKNWVAARSIRTSRTLVQSRPMVLMAVVSMSFALVAGCAGTGPDGGGPDGGGSGGMYLDGKLLPADSGSIDLQKGTHVFSSKAGGTLRYSGAISGPGELRVELPATTTLVLDGELSYAGMTVESGTVDLTKAIDRSGNVTVLDAGVVKRIATPVDISSGVRVWLDALRTWTLFQDQSIGFPVSGAGQTVGFWKGLDKWKGVSATRSLTTGITSLGGGAGLVMSENSFQIPDVELRDEYTIAALYRPISIIEGRAGCVLSSWGTPGVEASICFSPVTGANKFDLVAGSYVATTGKWATTASYLYNVVADGTSRKFLPDAGVDTIIISAANDAGTVLQINGQQVSSESTPFESRNDSNFDYYIGRRWDRSEYVNMGLKEVIIANDFNSAETLTGYLAWRHGLQAQLDANHPFKAGAPTAVINKDGTSVYRPCDNGNTCLVSFQSSCSPRCNTGVRCGSANDCYSRSCVAGTCAAPECSPSCKTGFACGSDSDCTTQFCRNGFCDSRPLCAPFCGLGAACSAAADCLYSNCVNNLCAAPVCSPNCAAATKCSTSEDCVSSDCANGVCAALACSPSCAIGNKCSVGTDCSTKVCTTNRCAACSPTCAAGAACTLNTDCQSGLCSNNVCVAITCSPKCTTGAQCAQNTNCLSGVCTTNVCANPACSSNCAKDAKCGQNSDCLSKVCTDGLCANPACSGTCGKGVNCGLATDCLSGVCTNGLCANPACASACAKGAKCGLGTDCLSGVCTSGSCANPVCSPACPKDGKCGIDSDCLSGVCTSGLCANPACSSACAKGEKCGLGSDCLSGVCTSGFCANPACAPGCATGVKCAQNSDCQSGVCTKNLCT